MCSYFPSYYEQVTECEGIPYEETIAILMATHRQSCEECRESEEYVPDSRSAALTLVFSELLERVSQLP